MTDHLFEDLVEICGFTPSRLESMKTYPNDPWVQLLLLKIDEEISHELADLHVGWHLANAAGHRRCRRTVRQMMKSQISVCFTGPEWRNRTEQDKVDALRAAWNELDEQVRHLVQEIFHPRDGEYMLVLGWIVQAALAFSGPSCEHKSCDCNPSLHRANPGPNV